MSVSTEQMSSLYEQQGYLSGVSVLDPAELRHAREAFAQLERKFGEYQSTVRCGLNPVFISFQFSCWKPMGCHLKCVFLLHEMVKL